MTKRGRGKHDKTAMDPAEREVSVPPDFGNDCASGEWVNPRSLEQARKRLGFEIDEVAIQAAQLGSDYDGINAESLRSWEAGETAPEIRHLEALAHIYVCPVGWFFLSRIPAEPIALDFRGVARGTRVGPRGMQTLSRFLELADWAEEVAVLTGQLTAPAIGQASLRDDIEAVAAVERRRLGFSSQFRSEWESAADAFNWWRRQIEGLGIFCFVMRLPTSEARGASYWGKHGSAFILVNSEDAEAATGRTFTLLHEYAHLILRESLVCDFRGTGHGAEVERFANRVAARMLLDAPELTATLREIGVSGPREQWSDALLDRIRTHFHVSRDVVSIYLEELGLAPVGFYRRRRDAWAKRRGFGRPTGRRTGRTLTAQRLRMVGSKLATVLASHKAQESLSPLDLAEALDVKLERVPALLDAFRKGGADE